MATSTPPADQALEFQVFGRSLQTEDWLRDIRLRSSLLFLPLPVRDVNRLLITRMARRSSWAIPHGERIIKSLENRTEAFLTEISRIRESLEASAHIETAGGTTIGDAYMDDVDHECKDLIEERQKLQAEWGLLRPPGPARTGDRVAQAQRYFEQAMIERGSDRGILLREARNALIEVGNAQPIVHPILWLAQGWATWYLTENYLEVVPILQRVEQHPIPSVASSVAYRMLSYFAELDQSPSKAFEWAQKSLEIRQTADSCLDAGMCALALHDPGIAKAYLEQALVLRSGSLIAALGDERSLIGGSELLEVAVRVQLRLRRDGRRSVSAWATAAREVGEAQRICPGGLHMPHELMEGHKQVLERFEDCDLIVGGYLTRSSAESAVEVLDCAKKNLQGEYVKRCDAVSMARKSIEGAGAWRDSRVKAALTEQEEMNRRANALLVQSDDDAERAERGSLFGFAGGCALFAIYMVSFLILADRGVPIGITTPVGIMATIVSAVPIICAIGLQIAHAFKRVALENRVEETLKKTKIAHEQASADADDEYREQIKQHRRTLAGADAELKKVEAAMRALGVKRAADVPELEEVVLEEEAVPQAETDDSLDIESTAA